MWRLNEEWLVGWLVHERDLVLDWTPDQPINYLADEMITHYPAVNLSNLVSWAHYSANLLAAADNLWNYVRLIRETNATWSLLTKTDEHFVS